MTDKELLELAAKAAGIDLVPKPFTHNFGEKLLCKSGQLWNPFTDDGDALRLAVKLGLVLYLNEVDDNTDPYAATRRDIVLTAAYIGREMK